VQIIPLQTLGSGLRLSLAQLQVISVVHVKSSWPTARKCCGRAMGLVTGSNLSVLIPSIALVANSGHHDTVQHIIPFEARQIAAASVRDDQFPQTTCHRAANPGLMRQHLQGIDDEIEQFSSQWVFGLVQKSFLAQQILECRRA